MVMMIVEFNGGGVVVMMMVVLCCSTVEWAEVKYKTYRKMHMSWVWVCDCLCFVRCSCAPRAFSISPAAKEAKLTQRRNESRVKQKSKDKHCIKNEEKWKYQRKQNIYYFFPLFTFRLAILERTPHHTTYSQPTSSKRASRAAMKPNRTIQPVIISSPGWVNKKTSNKKKLKSLRFMVLCFYWM